MPLPASYTEVDLAYVMLAELGGLGRALGWVPEAPPLSRAIDLAVAAYHGNTTDTIAAATDLLKLEALARVQLWKAVERATAGDYRFSIEGSSFDRHQVHGHAVAMVAQAEREAVAYGAGPGLIITDVIHRDDPYGYLPEEFRTVPA